MAYHEFAYFYDEFNGAADYDALYRRVKQELDAHGVKDGIVADLGCGTGELTLMLSQAGYDMIGIDQSEEMLAVVRDKAEQLGLSGKLLLLRQDICRLDLYGTIRAAVSTFDTLNHVSDLEGAIRSAAFFMEEGGVFLFDMNTPYKQEKLLGENEFSFDGPDAACRWKNHYDASGKKVDITIDIDYRDTGEHFTEAFSEYTYPEQLVKSILEKYGFTLESICDGESFGPLQKESPRYFFCAVKRYTQLGDTAQ
jgi:ubiquinone/menaquinone biosynthesis C-methylase UbiE